MAQVLYATYMNYTNIHYQGKQYQLMGQKEVLMTCEVQNTLNTTKVGLNFGEEKYIYWVQNIC